MVGETLSHYHIIEKIGTGGMGVVYRAHDEQLDRDVALKVLPAGTLADETARKRFRKEALAIAKFNHPNIATVHEFNSHAGVDFLAMELINGRSLREILKNGPVPEMEIQGLGAQLMEGLAAAHEHGVIHRDLKPANIMITPEGRLKILDFGLAKLAQVAGTEAAPSSSENESASGTLPYMAPEQLHGEPADPRTDVYGAGAVLYEMATGRRPFPEPQTPHLINSVLHRLPQPPRELNPQLSLGMQAAILKTLEKDPGDRYQSARELRSELEKLRSEVAAAQPPVLESQAPPLEIAHVLFMDLVAYSKMPMDQQRRCLRELQKTVQGTPEFIRAKAKDQLISLATGDGMALVFFEDPEAPVRCALELGRALRNNPEIKLRMGLHTGPVYRVPDVNANRNVAGGGINTSQRVMDCGNAGHILVSKAMVDVLGQLSRWNCSLHDLGEAEVKHELRLHLFNFYTDEVGNPSRPTRMGRGRVSRSLSPQPEKKARTPESGAGRVQRRKSEPATGGGSETTPNSSSTHTVQIVLPQISRRALLFAAVILLALVSVTFAIPSVRSRVFGRATVSLAPPEGVPSLAEGKFLAVLPLDEVNGDTETLGLIAQGVNEEVPRKLSSLQALHVVWDADTEKEGAKRKFNLKGPLETTARNLGANLVLQMTAVEGGGWIHVNLHLENVAERRALLHEQFSANALDGPLTLAERIYREILRALRLNPSKEEEERSANPTSSSQAYASYLKGRNARIHHREQGFNVAVGFFELAVKQDPRFSLAYAQLAETKRFLCRGTGDESCWNEVLEIAQRARKLNDNLPDVHLVLAGVYSETGHADEAITEYKRALQISPSDEGWRRLGQAYRSNRQKERAIEAFTQAAMYNSHSIYAQNELGEVYLENGQYRDAEDAFRLEIKLDPDNYAGYLNIGEVYRCQARYEDAVAEYQQALQHHPDVEAYTGLGLAYLYLRRYRDAIKMLEKGFDLSPSWEVIVGSLADGYHWSGQNEKAQATYDKAILLGKKDLATRPRDVVVLDHLGLYYAKRGNAALADQYIGLARSIDPSDPRLIYDEAIVCALADRPTRAMESLRLAFSGDHYLAQRAKFEPAFGNLQGRPEFKKLVTQSWPH